MFGVKISAKFDYDFGNFYHSNLLIFKRTFAPSNSLGSHGKFGFRWHGFKTRCSRRKTFDFNRVGHADSQTAFNFRHKFSVEFHGIGGTDLFFRRYSPVVKKISELYKIAIVGDSRHTTCKFARDNLVLQSNFFKCSCREYFGHTVFANCNCRRTYRRNCRVYSAIFRKNIFYRTGVNFFNRHRNKSTACKYSVQCGTSSNSWICRRIFILCRNNFQTSRNFIFRCDNFACRKF